MKSVLPPYAPAGSVVGLLPAPCARPVVVGAMSYTAQCQKPAPVGASGSCTCSCSDLVPAGMPLHTSCGETFCPVQPKPLRMYFVVNLPSARSGLDSVNCGVCASLWQARNTNGAAASDAVSN